MQILHSIPTSEAGDFFTTTFEPASIDPTRTRWVAVSNIFGIFTPSNLGKIRFPNFDFCIFFQRGWVEKPPPTIATRMLTSGASRGPKMVNAICEAGG